MAGASSFTLRGTCKIPYLSPGCRLTILMGDTPLGDYLVTAVEHHLSPGNHYTSTFTAVGGEVEIVPTPVIKAPAAEAELAVVRHNDDPQGQGRVRVQFQWQEASQLTDWIRVMSPDAGGGGDKVAKNRGFVFIPEVGDLVMVAYRDGNPDAPFVLGSMHHGKVAGGGGQGNKTKGLTTRSGSTVSLDDEKGSVTVSDPSGNTVILHGQVYGPPFVVTAVGDPEALRRALDRDPGVAFFRTFVDRFGLGYEVRSATSVTLPAYDGPLELPSVRLPGAP